MDNNKLMQLDDQENEEYNHVQDNSNHEENSGNLIEQRKQQIEQNQKKLMSLEDNNSDEENNTLENTQAQTQDFTQTQAFQNSNVKKNTLFLLDENEENNNEDNEENDENDENEEVEVINQENQPIADEEEDDNEVYIHKSGKPMQLSRKDKNFLKLLKEKSRLNKNFFAKQYLTQIINLSHFVHTLSIKIKNWKGIHEIIELLKDVPKSIKRLTLNIKSFKSTQKEYKTQSIDQLEEILKEIEGFQLIQVILQDFVFKKHYYREKIEGAEGDEEEKEENDELDETLIHDHTQYNTFSNIEFFTLRQNNFQDFQKQQQFFHLINLFNNKTVPIKAIDLNFMYAFGLKVQNVESVLQEIIKCKQTEYLTINFDQFPQYGEKCYQLTIKALKTLKKLKYFNFTSSDTTHLSENEYKEMFAHFQNLEEFSIKICNISFIKKDHKIIIKPIQRKSQFNDGITSHHLLMIESYIEMCANQRANQKSTQIKSIDIDLYNKLILSDTLNVFLKKLQDLEHLEEVKLIIHSQYLDLKVSKILDKLNKDENNIKFKLQVENENFECLYNKNEESRQLHLEQHENLNKHLDIITKVIKFDKQIDNLSLNYSGIKTYYNAKTFYKILEVLQKSQIELKSINFDFSNNDRVYDQLLENLNTFAKKMKKNCKELNTIKLNLSNCKHLTADGFKYITKSIQFYKNLKTIHMNILGTKVTQNPQNKFLKEIQKHHSETLEDFSYTGDFKGQSKHLTINYLLNLLEEATNLKKVCVSLPARQFVPYDQQIKITSKVFQLNDLQLLKFRFMHSEVVLNKESGQLHIKINCTRSEKNDFNQQLKYITTYLHDFSENIKELDILFYLSVQSQIQQTNYELDEKITESFLDSLKKCQNLKKIRINQNLPNETYLSQKQIKIGLELIPGNILEQLKDLPNLEFVEILNKILSITYYHKKLNKPSIFLVNKLLFNNNTRIDNDQFLKIKEFYQNNNHNMEELILKTDSIQYLGSSDVFSTEKSVQISSTIQGLQNLKFFTFDITNIHKTSWSFLDFYRGPQLIRLLQFLFSMYQSAKCINVRLSSLGMKALNKCVAISSGKAQFWGANNQVNPKELSRLKTLEYLIKAPILKKMQEESVIRQYKSFRLLKLKRKIRKEVFQQVMIECGYGVNSLDIDVDDYSIQRYYKQFKLGQQNDFNVRNFSIEDEKGLYYKK